MGRRCVANRTRWVVLASRRLIAERTVPVRATRDLRKTQDAHSLSLRERARVRGNETQPTQTEGECLRDLAGLIVILSPILRIHQCRGAARRACRGRVQESPKRASLLP
jgi:hypothetical protein